MEIRISGLDQTVANLKSAPAIIVFKAFAIALDRAGGVIQAAMEARAPDRDEGILKENGVVDIRIDPAGRGGVAHVGYSSKQSERTGKPADAIAQWVEYGHLMLDHNRKSTKLGHVPANPFMHMAAEEVAGQAIAVFADMLEQQMESMPTIGVPTS